MLGIVLGPISTARITYLMTLSAKLSYGINEYDEEAKMMRRTVIIRRVARAFQAAQDFGLIFGSIVSAILITYTINLSSLTYINAVEDNSTSARNFSIDCNFSLGLAQSKLIGSDDTYKFDVSNISFGINVSDYSGIVENSNVPKMLVSTTTSNNFSVLNKSLVLNTSNKLIVSYNKPSVPNKSFNPIVSNNPDKPIISDTSIISNNHTDSNIPSTPRINSPSASNISASYKSINLTKNNVVTISSAQSSNLDDSNDSLNVSDSNSIPYYNYNHSHISPNTGSQVSSDESSILNNLRKKNVPIVPIPNTPNLQNTDSNTKNLTCDSSSSSGGVYDYNAFLDDIFDVDEFGDRLCGSQACPSKFLLTYNSSDETYFHVLPKKTAMILACVYIGIVTIAFVMALFGLDRMRMFVHQDPLERSEGLAALRAVKESFKDFKLQLATPLAVFIGLEQAFMYADFSKVSKIDSKYDIKF